MYNPFDILLLFKKKEFRPYWFETGTPTFLVELWKQQPRVPAEYDGLIAGEEILSSFEIASLKTETLLFQTGYLTIREVLKTGPLFRYRLGFPNFEVRSAFNQLVLMHVAPSEHLSEKQYRIVQILSEGDTEGLKQIFDALLASIPHDWHRKNNIAEYEGYWSTVVYCFLASLGYDTIPEDTTSRGNIDLAMLLPEAVWVFEFKVGQSSPESIRPIAQINEKGYVEKYLSHGKPVHTVGIVFDPEKRAISGWETAVIA